MEDHASRPRGAGDEDVLRGLLDLGLTTKEARAYLTLLRVAPATASEIADSAGIARPKVYEALKSLEQRGFCFLQDSRVARFHAVDAEVALPEWVRRREHERRAATERDKRLVAELLTRLPRSSDRNDLDAGRYMHATVGADAALNSLIDIVGRAEKRLDVVVTAPVIQPRSEWNVSELRALERGVSVRVLYAAELVAEAERYLPLLEAGAEVRASNDLPLKMIVRDDGAEAVVSLLDDANDGIMTTNVLIRHSELAAPFQLLFNRQWRHARVFTTAARRPA